MENAPRPLFYREVVALSRERHKGWFIDPEQGFSFAGGTNSVFLAASEFGPAAREFPIVFAPAGPDRVIPAALLGLRKDENLMVADDGRWAAGYVPAYVRRYPFILARPDADSDTFTVCIDESFSGFNTAREGEPLVDEEGKQGEFVERTVKFLQDFHQHTQLTARFCEALVEAGLLEDMQAQVSLDSGEEFSLAGFRCVSRKKLADVPAEQLKTFLDAGYLELIFFHMHSLANMDKLIRRVGERATRQ